jgi:hypothetical protein
MRNYLRELRTNLQSAWWHFIHPEWDEPPRDETTPEVISAWIAKHKHPDACRGGCRCDLRKEV